MENELESTEIPIIVIKYRGYESSINRDQQLRLKRIWNLDWVDRVCHEIDSLLLCGRIEFRKVLCTNNGQYLRQTAVILPEKVLCVYFDHMSDKD
jgi:hypothetical protein